VGQDRKKEREREPGVVIRVTPQRMKENHSCTNYLTHSVKNWWKFSPESYVEGALEQIEGPPRNSAHLGFQQNFSCLK
jgi:hypothetical protein